MSLDGEIDSSKTLVPVYNNKHCYSPGDNMLYIVIIYGLLSVMNFGNYELLMVADEVKFITWITNITEGLQMEFRYSPWNRP